VKFLHYISVLLPSLTVIIAVRQLLDVEHITDPDPARLLNDNTDILATFLVNSSTVSTKKTKPDNF